MKQFVILFMRNCKLSLICREFNKNKKYLLIEEVNIMGEGTGLLF